MNKWAARILTATALYCTTNNQALKQETLQQTIPVYYDNTIPSQQRIIIIAALRQALDQAQTINPAITDIPFFRRPELKSYIVQQVPADWKNAQTFAANLEPPFILVRNGKYIDHHHEGARRLHSFENANRIFLSYTPRNVSAMIAATLIHELAHTLPTSIHTAAPTLFSAEINPDDTTYTRGLAPATLEEFYALEQTPGKPVAAASGTRRIRDRTLIIANDAYFGRDYAAAYFRYTAVPRSDPVIAAEADRSANYMRRMHSAAVLHELVALDKNGFRGLRRFPREPATSLEHSLTGQPRQTYK